MSYDTAVQQWIMAITGYDDQHVFQSQQTGPRPSDAHATYLNIASDDAEYSEVKKDETDPKSDDYEVSYTAPKTLVYSINIFDPKSKTLLTHLWKARYLLAPRLALRTEGMVLRQKSTSRQIPTPGDTSWRSQHSADFTFAIMTVDIEDVEKLYTYRLEGRWTRVESDDLDVVITDN